MEQRLFGFSRPVILTVAMAASWFMALQLLDASRILAASVTAQSASRAAAIALAWTSRPASMGFTLSSRISTSLALFAMLQGLAAALLIGGVRLALLLTAASYLVLRLAQVWCYKRRGGIDEKGFWAAQAGVELLVLAVWSVIPSTS